MRASLLFILSALYSCGSIKDLSGKYHSYNIQIDFKPDSTFDFDLSGHGGDHATGRYNIDGRFIRLNYNKEYDTSIADLLSSRDRTRRVNCLYFEKRKLFPCDSTGKITREYPNGTAYFFKKVKSSN
jgi:hypothetical protein